VLAWDVSTVLCLVLTTGFTLKLANGSAAVDRFANHFSTSSAMMRLPNFTLWLLAILSGLMVRGGEELMMLLGPADLGTVEGSPQQ